MNRHQRGVTLIELMITLSIVAILGAVAVSSYRSYSLRANRIDAAAQLLKVTVAEEKYFLQNSTYTTDLADAPPTGLGIPTTTPTGFYTLAVAAGAAGIASSYTVTATATGAQTKDKSACLTLSITDQGVRTPADSSGCWH